MPNQRFSEDANAPGDGRMNPNVDAYSQPTDSFSVLVVDPALSDLLFVVSALSVLRAQVTVAETFAQARDLLGRFTPDVLVAAIRLGEYNGLHLVLRGKASRPGMGAVLTSPCHDPVLLADADAMQTTFVVTPVSEEEIRAAVLRTLFRAVESTDPIRTPFERRRRDRRIGQSVAIVGPDRRQPFGDRRRALAVSGGVPVIGSL
jgi:CheY-like chemotaxis protein